MLPNKSFNMTNCKNYGVILIFPLPHKMHRKKITVVCNCVKIIIKKIF